MVKGSFVRLINPEKDTVGGYGQQSDAYIYYVSGRLGLNIQYKVLDPDYGMTHYGHRRDRDNEKHWITILVPCMGTYIIDRRCFKEVEKKFKRNLPEWF